MSDLICQAGSRGAVVLQNPIALSSTASLLAACLVLLTGAMLTRNVGVLAKYNIPDPIVGGVLFAILVALLGLATGLRVSLDVPTRSTLLLIFFACVGMTADMRLLAQGGARLLRFLLVLFPFLFAQDALGVVVAKGLGLHPLLGLLGGTITLVGGHGTGAAYAQRFADVNNIQGVMELTMTSATLGLVVGGVIGGPVAQWLIRRHGLFGATPAKEDKGVGGGPVTTPVTLLSFMGSLAVALIAMMAGRELADLTEGAPLTMPSFVWCLFVAVVIRNGGPFVGLRLNDAASELIGSVCLSVFLSWTMMALDLGSVVRLAGPLLIILVFQTVLVAVWAILLAFRIVGRDYESAVMAGAFCGFAMGATATAIANMQALTRRYGPAPQAFLVVPVAGAFFIDIMNAAVLTIFLSLGFVGGG
ncbi:MAG: sodium/glutamate symporter [Acetobacteraceae bacterium]|nr:sodium/glutamate symporter [Acetobacteraceae bacterium]